jgi:hypothetical protein
VDTSPFIDPTLCQRWLKERLDRCDNDPRADVEALMGELACEINLRIRSNLARSKALQQRFAQVTGRPYAPEP